MPQRNGGDYSDRFWSRVEKTDGCWLWRGTVHHTGYGVLTIMDESRPHGKYQVRVHRLSYEMAKGQIPTGMCVCHACDTPLCVNPAHLWLGSQIENQADATKKGRKRVAAAIASRAAAVAIKTNQDSRTRHARARSEALKNQWLNPGFRERHIARVRALWSDPEWRARNLKARWQAPDTLTDETPRP